ncbi:MAG TPA: hypothetical protein VNW74_11770 [Mycobacterium sp.]|nr:hypothetical protein [Mycobacterium sp.]
MLNESSAVADRPGLQRHLDAYFRHRRHMVGGGKQRLASGRDHLRTGVKQIQQSPTGRETANVLVDEHANA